jgi:L-lactate utilization protein LutC
VTDRDAFLAVLRERLRLPAPENLPHPAPRVDGVPMVRFVTPVAATTETLRGSIERSGATFHDGSLEAALSAVVERHGVRSAIVSRDPEVEGAAGVLRALGVTVLAFEEPTSGRDAGLGVVGCAYAIASTGSLVLDASRAGGRTASLVPPVILAAVDRTRILADPSALLRDLPRHFPDGPPSQLVLHTGPSRSGDIEGILTQGVHGPGAVHVCLVGES